MYCPVAKDLDDFYNPGLSFRADNLECYGSQWIDCLHLNSFAKECVIFEDCYPEGLPTVPVRQTLMPGRRILPFHYYRQHEPAQSPGTACG